MLNLFTIKKNIIREKSKFPYYLKLKTSKHFPSPLREWKNSIYVYNMKNISLIPSVTISVNKFIKSYFNLFNQKLEIKMRTRKLLLRLRRMSSNKYYISNGGFKHSNNKVLINLYVFNRQNINYLSTLKNVYLNTFLTKGPRNINVKIISRLKLINKKGIQAVKMLNKDKYLLIKALNSVLNNKKYNLNTFRYLSRYTENFYKNLIKKSLRKLKTYFNYKQLQYLNRSKLNYISLYNLTSHLEKLYKKNVEFNIINLKRFYLNSDIISESISLKIAKNRRNVIKNLVLLKKKIPVKKKDSVSFNKPINLKKLSQKQYQLIVQKSVINDLKYKNLTGFKLEARGRISKRFTASRSNFLSKNKGSLLDVDSSNKGLSSVLLKGNLKSNMQYCKLNSKSRTGSFGIKCWISGN